MAAHWTAPLGGTAHIAAAVVAPAKTAEALNYFAKTAEVAARPAE